MTDDGGVRPYDPSMRHVTREEIQELDRRAIEEFYGVNVTQVRTMLVRGKNKRWGRHLGKRSNWKKAYVTVAEGQSLPVFDAGL